MSLFIRHARQQRSPEDPLRCRWGPTRPPVGPAGGGRPAYGDLVQVNQLTVHYQPQIELPREARSRMAALVRWHHPRFGVLAPADLLPLAEQSGLMAAPSTSVLAITAAGRATVWWHEGYELTMAVNITPTAMRANHCMQGVEHDHREPAGCRRARCGWSSPRTWTLRGPRPGPADAEQLARAPRRRPLGRRVRRGLLVTGHRAGVAGRRDQDRPTGRTTSGCAATGARRPSCNR